MEAYNQEVSDGMNAGAILEACPDKPASKYEILREWPITITFCDSGCTIRVGCKTVAFSHVNEAMNALNEYVTNPKKSTEIWNKVFNENN